jgi:sugar lactone lactonase YvrE
MPAKTLLITEVTPRADSMLDRRTLLLSVATFPIMAHSAESSADQRWRRGRIFATGLSSPVGMALDSEGRLLVANWSAGTVVRVSQNGQVTTIAAGLEGPSGLALAANGDIFVASYSGDVVWKILKAGKREVFARGLATPAGLSFDSQGRLLIANRRTNQILAADSAGQLSVAVEGDLQTPVGAVHLPDGSYFVSNINGGVAYAKADGRAHTVSREFLQPGPGIAIADTESVFVVDYGGTEVKPVYSDGRTKIVAGGFKSPVGLLLSADRRTALVADWGSNSASEMNVGSK